MDLRKRKTLIDFVSESNISELEITEAEGKAPDREGRPSLPRAHVMPCILLSGPQPRPRRRRPPRPATAPLPQRRPAVTRHMVKSPMVGTFYRSPSPGAKAFVEVGDRSRPARPCASSRP